MPPEAKHPLPPFAPRRQARGLNPVTLAASLLLAGGTLFCLGALYQKVKLYQRTQSAMHRLELSRQGFERQLGRDLLQSSFSRSTCWRPPVQLEKGAAGPIQRVLLVLPNPKVFTFLASPAPAGSQYLHLANMAGAHPGVLLRLCIENVAETVRVATAFSFIGGGQMAPVQEQNLEKKQEGRIAFTGAQSGDRMLRAGFPAGTVVQAVEEVEYEKQETRVVRKTLQFVQPVLAGVSDFQWQLNPAIGGGSANYLLDYELVDEIVGLRRRFQFTWNQWPTAPALTADQAANLLDKL